MLQQKNNQGSEKQKRAQSAKRNKGRFNRFLGIVTSSVAFSSLTRRIVFLNLAALAVLVIGILYLNQFREGLIDSRVRSLMTQGNIIAGAIAASAASDADAITISPDRLLELQAGESFTPSDDTFGFFEFPIDPERAAPILRAAISTTDTRARIYDLSGNLVVDSRQLNASGILRFNLPDPVEEKDGGWMDKWSRFISWIRQAEHPLYKELGSSEGRGYPEVTLALDGSAASIVRVNDKGRLIVSVAVPIQRSRVIAGALLLSTRDGEIDEIVTAERLGILRVFLIAAVVTSTLSFLLAGTIAGPVRRLSEAAERVRRGVKSREQIPDFSDRKDEIGQLSQSLRDMTKTLYQRMDAIEAFAADVAHELKNPLTSLRSAVETLPLAKKPEARERLTGIILHDVRRLDRLISDISDASRLDAELARQDSDAIDLHALLDTIVTIQDEIGAKVGVRVKLETDGEPAKDDRRFFVNGNDSRIGQVFVNLIDNARSFSPDGSEVVVSLSREDNWVEVTVDDCGPGIQAEDVNRVFERFYTDRPQGEDFGQNSGLGLSISKQIVEAYQGQIEAFNRIDESSSESDPEILGARFCARFPVMAKTTAHKPTHHKTTAHRKSDHTTERDDQA
ncbi:two-component system, OmpR family, sensor histidine kinase ChvG [Cohaesibacter sp. ES.047]|uniref:sensor histidine kinase n=1 Tax=Cohaesibacter sp. ES.047 TaxID=1798205 RepID=UPI000BB7ACA8|nr:sensor histidine kinase [Cohaesibacter sp. ES.047]SNY90151.1 two-component system, OmpR family, sensor histidine kinase ChvG [Cohaesibacter sp. ES.047]